MQEIKVKTVHRDAVLPTYATEGAAGFDLRACLGFSFCLLDPGSRTVIKTGLAFEIPPGFEIQVRPRSGLSRDGIDVVLGTIDSDYRGEVGILLINNTKHAFRLNNRERIAQGVLARVPAAKFVEASELSETARGQGGFGSTGSK